MIRNSRLLPAIVFVCVGMMGSAFTAGPAKKPQGKPTRVTTATLIKQMENSLKAARGAKNDAEKVKLLTEALDKCVQVAKKLEAGLRPASAKKAVVKKGVTKKPAPKKVAAKKSAAKKVVAKKPAAKKVAPGQKPGMPTAD